MKKHATHPAVLARLKRAQGHLHSIITMIEEERSCADIAQQLQAVEKAVGHAKHALIHDHIEHCIDDSRNNSAGIRELKDLAKYLS
jgi:uncharacterized protein